jgi:hypothetical protein
MPNDCVNRVTIYADEETTAKLVALGSRFADMLPEPADPIHETWGSDRFHEYSVYDYGKTAIAFRFMSAWAPPLGFFDELLRTYKNISFVKVDWNVEDGMAGVWVGSRIEGEDGYGTEKMQWDEGCIEEHAHRFRK